MENAIIAMPGLEIVAFAVATADGQLFVPVDDDDAFCGISLFACARR